jgi:uncharacterized protein YcgI (DUF1989 family)
MSVRHVSICFNHQQMELIERAVASGAAENAAALVRRALREYHAASVDRTAPATGRPRGRPAGTRKRKLVSEYVLEPGTGKALEVRSGQILRVEQIQGAQCVDFNCFNLHDYKEAMHVGRMRAMYGLVPSKGDFIWSAPPREQAMMYILEDSVGCNDVMFSRCNAYLYESVYGFAGHTNCHDIQAEAQREFGLTPDDVHDSFNMFMCTEVRDGRLQINRQKSAPGDHVELLALMDVLAVPNVCGNDVGRTSNFSLKPVKIGIFAADQADLDEVPPLPRFPNSQRTPESFLQSKIKADRPLRRDPNYVPAFQNYPLRENVVELTLDEAEYQLLGRSQLQEYYGDDAAATLRDVLFSWWERVFAVDLPGTT